MTKVLFFSISLFFSCASFAAPVSSEPNCEQYIKDNVTVSCCDNEKNLMVNQCDEVFVDSRNYTCCAQQIRKNISIDTSKVSPEDDNAQKNDY